LTRWLSDGRRNDVPWQHLRLGHGPVTLRAIERRDHAAWKEVRSRNHAWLRQWEATRPPGDDAPLVTFPAMVRDLRRQARQGRCLPFALLVDGEFAGQVTVSNIVGGSARFASVGYWIDQRHAGRGYVPVAVALAVDHCFFAMGLHRIEIAIRPENAASLRVVEKLGLAEIGYAPRFLHIDGEWRDHRVFAVTVEEAPEGLLSRLPDR
jgi:ribosomal-protein-alanine N-acetyltransferase